MTSDVAPHDKLLFSYDCCRAWIVSVRLYELYGHGRDMVEKVLLMNDIAYPILYPPKENMGEM